MQGQLYTCHTTVHYSKEAMQYKSAIKQCNTTVHYSKKTQCLDVLNFDINSGGSLPCTIISGQVFHDYT